MNNRGYTLIELLIYVVIFATAAGMLSGVLITFTRIQSQESASSEVTQQLSFVQSTIQRLVREAVNIESATSSVLTLRMASPTLDPTVISKVGDAVYLTQGSGETAVTSTLTSDKVKVTEFEVAKYENPGGHAVVQLNLSLSYNSQKLYQQITRNLATSIGRVTAATFDDNLLPNEDDSFTIGVAPNYRWKKTILSDGTAISPSYTFGNDTSLGLFKISGSSALGFTTTSTERMRITEAGNVGIATTTPSYKLDVQGTIQMTGFKMPTGAASDYVLTSDASGVGTWQAAGGGLPSGTQGDILYYNGTSWVQLSAGSNGQVLKTQGSGANPVWTTINPEPDWTVAYDGKVEPPVATPAWVLNGTDKATSDGNVLSIIIQNDEAVKCYYRQNQAGDYWYDNVSNATGWTVEFRMKVLNAGIDTLYFYAKDGTRYAGVWWKPAGTVHFSGDGWAGHTISEGVFHTYRITTQGTSSKLYVDGALVVDGTLSGAGEKEIYFGHLNDALTDESNSQWDYVKYYTGGAIPPTTP